jgi:hypothetical protein
MDGLEPEAGEVSLACALYTTYALMGPSRAVPRVSAQAGKHLRWCERLCSRFHWRERALRYDAAMAQAIAARLVEQAVAHTEAAA